MDADGNNSGEKKLQNGEAENSSGAASRVRTQSECSLASDDGQASNTDKRRRTTSQTYMVTTGFPSASPPKFVSLEEIMHAANSMRDMALVHHIAVDDNFVLKRYEPEENSLHKVVKETMHKAFWDVLKQELNEDPPTFTQAMVLLENIKEDLFSLLLPQHTKIKQQISEVLDTELIRQQAENETLDFKHYAQFVISIMAKMCAPVRDEKIKQLTETTDVIETFKGILETLDLMKLDMANFTLAMTKPEIIANSVEIERKKFADYLAITPDGLEITRKWLLKHLDTSSVSLNPETYDTQIKNITKITFARACIEFLEWDPNIPYPETFMLDEDRLKELQIRAKRLVTITTVLLVTLNSLTVDLQTIAVFKQELKDKISILLQAVRTDKEIEETLPNVAEQVINDVKEAQAKYNLLVLEDSATAALKEQIVNIAKEDHRIKQLVWQRIKEFLLETIESSTAAPQKVPSGLSALRKELTEVAGPFLRIVSHNNTVFCIYYLDIITAALPKPS